jgi:biopolymer transport protein ExbD
MAVSSSSPAGSGLLTEINVTPLVDVVLVLLILMMVTATSLASRTIPVELPKAKTAEGDSTERPLVVAVDEHGAMFLDKDPADEARVRARARAAATDPAGQPRPASAVLAADGRARHEAVVHVLEILRSERVAKIAIVVRSEAP